MPQPVTPATPPRIWPTARERLAFAKRETLESLDWRKTVLETALPFVVSLVGLRYVLDPEGWRDEAILGAVSLAAGLVVPVTRFLVSLWQAPKKLAQEKYTSAWYEILSWRERQGKLDAILDVDVEIGGGPFVRPAKLPGATPEADGRVYALQGTIITNRSDANVSLSFELWLPWAKQEAYLMIREHEHSGLGRTDTRYLKGPLNLAPRESSECKDIGFLLLPGHDDFFGKEIEYDFNRAVLRVIDRVSKKHLDVPVRRSTSEALRPPGWPAWP